MTDKQKDQITLMQHKGYGYKRIASALDLPVNGVKTYCHRHPVSPDCSQHRHDTCLQCGAPLKQITHRKPRKFCSDACRVKWWNSHRDLINHRETHQVTCRHCGKVFSTAKNSTRKYCSHGCYIADRFHRGEQQ